VVAASVRYITRLRAICRLLHHLLSYKLSKYHHGHSGIYASGSSRPKKSRGSGTSSLLPQASSKFISTPSTKLHSLRFHFACLHPHSASFLPEPQFLVSRFPSHVLLCAPRPTYPQWQPLEIHGVLLRLRRGQLRLCRRPSHEAAPHPNGT